MNNAIDVNDLTIRYKKFVGLSVKDIFSKKKNENMNYVEAVKGISFSVHEGGILGIIGKNGSGKSTLLRAIAGIFSADSGRIDLHEHKVSLLSIGVGFKPEMTGRENVILSGLLLGFTINEISERMEGIIEFAEIGEFIDAPVKTYSSGMYSKLAFSITVALETDITLIDEVLSVGDERFRVKSFNQMKKMILDKKRTVVIVSHSIPTLEELCDTVMWMHDGEIYRIGNPQEVLMEYKEFMSK